MCMCVVSIPRRVLNLLNQEIYFEYFGCQKEEAYLCSRKMIKNKQIWKIIANNT